MIDKRKEALLADAQALAKKREALAKEKEPAESQKELKIETNEKPLSWAHRLIKATLEIQNTLKADEKGYNFNYCPLPRLLNEAKTILAKFHLAVIQYIEVQEKEKYLITELFDLKGDLTIGPHSGQDRMVYTPPFGKIKNVMKLPEFKYKTTKTITDADFNSGKKTGKETTEVIETVFDYQDYGKQLTYFKRYSLFCILNIHPEKDDSENTKKPKNIYKGGQ